MFDYKIFASSITLNEILKLINYIPNFRNKSMMNSLLIFGLILLTCLVNSSNGQGYIRLSRADPMMSLMLNGKNNGMQQNSDAQNLDQDFRFDLMKKRANDAKRNFLNFIFRKYPDENGAGFDERNKRIPPQSHSVIDQPPIVMETYLRPYFDYLGD